MPYIDSINTNQTDYLISGVASIIICDTQANEQNKTAIAMDAFNLDSNLSFKIKFTYGNTANNPTLNLNNTGSKPILTTTSDFNLLSNTVYNCYYNGTNYIIDNQLSIHINNTNNPHNVTKSIIGLGNVDNTRDADKSVLSANQLTTARNIYVNLTNTDVSFTTDFSQNVILPIYGILDASHGGTGVSSLSSLKECMNLNNVQNTLDCDKIVCYAENSNHSNCAEDASYAENSNHSNCAEDASYAENSNHSNYADNSSCLCYITYNEEYTASYITGVSSRTVPTTLQSYRMFSDGFLIQYGTLCASESCISFPISYYNRNYKFFYTHERLNDSTCTSYQKYNDHICFTTNEGGTDCYDWMTIGWYTERI